MLKGKVIFFNKKSKFGFIKGDNGTDYYVHAKDIVEGSLEEGDEVEFDLKPAKRGPEACNVRKLTQNS